MQGRPSYRQRHKWHFIYVSGSYNNNTFIMEILWKLFKVYVLNRWRMFIYVYEEMCNQVQWWACQRRVRNLNKMIRCAGSLLCNRSHLHIKKRMLKRSVLAYKMGVRETKLSSSHLWAVILPPLFIQVK